MNSSEMWERYRRCLCVCESIGLTVDVSRMRFGDEFFERMAGPMSRAFEAMDALEAGAIANPDEARRVGHYWLRAPQLAPDTQITADIEQARQRIAGFAADVHAGRITAANGEPFANLLLLGIGGSTLGPQFVSDALGTASDPIRAYYCDNTDPDGFDRTFDQLGDGLARTLVLVVSKSGGTIETRNALLETAARYQRAGLDFPACAVAVTQDGSALHRRAEQEGWLAKFPMWDWVGGRTSVTSAVGMLPAALQGFDVEAILAGAGEADAVTRSHDTMSNPAALLALMWYHATDGRGARDMVVIPYKDRLALFPKYLQQLIMESLGKDRDLAGRAVCQGLTVYGNKGSTDQHAYVQQLRDGIHNFFVTFIGVRRDKCGTGWNADPTVWVEPEVTSGDYLHGFLLGTRQALWEKGRESITIMLDELTPRTVGILIALYERAVGLYASLINVNAYHQPGVEAGKQAAAGVIDLQRRLLAELKSTSGSSRTAQELAAAIGAPEQAEVAHHILDHLAANPQHGLARITGDAPWSAAYHLAP